MMARTFAIVLLAAASLQAQVTFERLLRAGDEPHNWLTYSGEMRNQRHTRLTQITPGNVQDLDLRWVWQARSLEKFEATPLVVDGVLYTVQAPNDVVALDAATGRIFWTFPAPSGGTTSSRRTTSWTRWEFKMNDITWAGVLTTATDVLFSGGKEGYFLALDARTGALLWKAALGGQINSRPMSYAIDGKQYIAVAAGNALFTFALRE